MYLYRLFHTVSFIPQVFNHQYYSFENNTRYTFAVPETKPMISLVHNLHFISAGYDRTYVRIVGKHFAEHSLRIKGATKITGTLQIIPP